MTRTINEHGLRLLREFEGLRLAAYRCPAGFWTIGFGHTATAAPGQHITVAEAEALLHSDVRRFAQGVTRMVTAPLGSNQFAALVCFAFNVGLHALENSTLLRLLNRGWYSQVPTQLLRWNKIKGRAAPGLTRRRQAEGQLWNSPDE
ncbi:MAG: lysozyme [Bdellovibrionales bacterium]